ncbi:uncharacterized protein [Montipora capricornis]|uniref:uncharacterized protein n=1 Tax=Montipora capricornis TaxID=246305 RepID=UPI0035F1DC73
MVVKGSKLLAAASGVEHSMVVGFIEICRQKSIDYVVAPYEADAELSFLLKQGHVDFVIFEDSDLLACGCKKAVINPLNGTTVPLTRWKDTPSCPEMEEYQIICGSILSREYAINLALGNVNPLDSNTVNSTFQLPGKEGLWQEKDMTMSVTSLEGKTDWTIPSFPVLTLTFVKASVSVKCSKLNALFKAETRYGWSLELKLYVQNGATL